MALKMFAVFAEASTDGRAFALAQQNPAMAGRTKYEVLDSVLFPSDGHAYRRAESTFGVQPQHGVGHQGFDHQSGHEENHVLRTPLGGVEEGMDQHTLHREEMLEAEIRKLRQCLKILADTVIAGDQATSEVEAKAVLEILSSDR